MKLKTIYICANCGAKSVRWQGRCPACGEWNTMVEEIVADEKKGAAAASASPKVFAKPVALTEAAESKAQRFSLDIEELNRVLGGGIVPGGSLLLGGEPGIGKSTILLQMAQGMAERYGSVFYITGEESASQVRMRAQRIGALSANVVLLAENNIEAALLAAAEQPRSLVIVDSVQALYSSALESAPGSVSQVRGVAAACLEFARERETAVVLVGHVNKEGMLAGPRVLEHMVDTVLYFEGERYTSLRLLRAVKNRFGSTNEIGVFEMTEQGLRSFQDASHFFLSQRPRHTAGSVVTCVMQGSRPILVEMQALVAPSSFGNPRRLATGLDYNRLLLIIAVLEKKTGLSLGNKDVYLNVAGGMRVDDPAADLAAAAAIASSFWDRPLEDALVVLGELGLLGEIRSVAKMEQRLRESKSFGFAKALVGKIAAKEHAERRLEGMETFGAGTIFEALLILDLLPKQNEKRG